MTEELSYARSEILTVVRDLEEIVVSLDRIGSYMADRRLPQADADRLLCEYLDTWRLFHKLAHARKVLQSAFGDQLGPDDLDELERTFKAMEEQGKLNYWTCPDP